MPISLSVLFSRRASIADCVTIVTTAKRPKAFK